MRVYLMKQCYIRHLWKFHLEPDLKHRSIDVNRYILIDTAWTSVDDSYVSALFFLISFLALV